MEDIPRQQFDQLLGGKAELPSSVSLMKFVASRTQEIAALTEAIEDPQNNHLAFQRMPKHLRRRAMSHNVKRMPKRLREVHLNQMTKSGLPIKAKRPSRKYRRKPSNLLAEYNRRQRSTMWLETHIWHAKRCHMVEQWGYKLPKHTTDKGFRACYRATSQHCLLQDISYLNCIELQGEEHHILQGLAMLTSPELGTTFAAKAYNNGNREGFVVLFKKGAYPYQCIGRVTFMWRPESKGLVRTLWIWCHPAFYNEVLQELIAVFGLKKVDNTEINLEILNLKEETINDKKSVESIKLEPKNIGKLPKYSSDKIIMILLKDTLNRFRLTGPLSQACLANALKFVEIENILKNEDTKMESDEQNIINRSEWLKEFYKDEFCFDCLKQQKAFWNELVCVNSAAELPRRRIYAATVMDPRLSMPSTRTKAVNTGERIFQVDVAPEVCLNSALWDVEVRDQVTHSKMSTAELNKLRSRALVPGMASAEWLGSLNVCYLPLLLIQNPGDQYGYSCGWDIILPAGWAMPVWLGLVFRGARVGGLRETERITLEATSGPVLAPDTQGGVNLAEQRQHQLRDKYFGRPPAKRPNYNKLGIVSPFNYPWIQLLKDWHPIDQHPGVYVIRRHHQLEFLRQVMRNPNMKTTASCTFSDIDKACGLILIGVDLCSRGTLRDGSLICALAKTDFNPVKGQLCEGPTEPLHEDEHEEKRKTLREAHLAKLKHLKKKRVKSKRLLLENDYILKKLNKHSSKQSPTEDIVKDQATLIKELWVPSEVENVKNSCSRCVMGYVTCGAFTFTKAKPTGYGYITLSSLLEYIERKQTHVFVRNTTSLQYYFSRLKVL